MKHLAPIWYSRWERLDDRACRNAIAWRDAGPPARRGSAAGRLRPESPRQKPAALGPGRDARDAGPQYRPSVRLPGDGGDRCGWFAADPDLAPFHPYGEPPGRRARLGA